jgi:hypothetical protein
MKPHSFKVSTRILLISQIAAHSLNQFLPFLLLMSMTSVIMAETVGHRNAVELPFAGCRVLVLKSDIPGNAWDSTMYGALVLKGMDVMWEENSMIDNPASLAQYDLVAMNIRRHFTPAELLGLKAFLASGGSLYITATPSWKGTELIDKDVLSLCGVTSYKIRKVNNLTLLAGPLTKELGEVKVLFPAWSGYMGHPDGVNVMSFVITDGTSVATDDKGKSLGVLKEQGQGRIALLSMSPENYKFCFPDSQIHLANRVFENTLNWLMPRGHKERPWSNVIEVRLPSRAKVLSVSLDDKSLTGPKIRFTGSFQMVAIPVMAVEPGKAVRIKITYEPLSKARNLETWVHHPSGEFCNVFHTPSEAADFLTALHATTVIPLLRSANGLTYYRGIPGDILCEEIKEYSGNYLAEYITECHRRGIKVIGDFYMSANASLDKYPDAAWIGKDGKPGKEPWVCLNNPKGQEHNLEAFRQLVETYQLDGIMLDDNFQMTDKPCYCDYCKNNFRIYCQRKGYEYKDPSSFTNNDAKLKLLWAQYMTEKTRAFCDKMKKICAKRGIPLGGWLNGEMSSTLHNAELFDFLGGMIYECPAYAGCGPISVLGEHCKFIDLLWAMNRSPEAMEAEVADAIYTGAPMVGFWTQFFGRDRSTENWGLYTGGHGDKKHKNYTWFIEPGGLDAIARAFSHAEEVWLSYYKENVITGDGRFAVQSGILKSNELIIKITNCGHQVTRRVQGYVDLTFLQ